MVKKNSEEPNSILFALGSLCQNWIKISAEQIANIEVLDSVPCKDHTHLLVRVRLVEPKSESESILAKLASAASSVASRTISQHALSVARQRLLPVGARVDPHFDDGGIAGCGTSVEFSGLAYLTAGG